MAIRYTKSLNAQIRKDVKHFNQVAKTLKKRGYKLTPKPIKVSELKLRHTDRKGLNKELRMLRKLSSTSDALLKEVENQGGATAIKWEYDYLKSLEKDAIEFFKRDREVELKADPIFPGERMRLNEIESSINILSQDVDYMNQDQFKEYSATIHDYMKMVEHMENGYRGFLYQIEQSMRMVGYSEESINSLFKQFKGLTPAQFHELYRTNDYIKRIYELVNSPVFTSEKELTLEPDDAVELIEALREQAPSEIARVKK